MTLIDAAMATRAPVDAPTVVQSVTVNGVAGSTREIVLSTANVPRLVISVDDSPENGSDSGSNVSLVVCGDDGKLTFQPIGINRATGEININTPMTVNVPGLDDDSALAISSGWVRDLLGQMDWVEVLSSTALELEAKAGITLTVFTPLPPFPVPEAHQIATSDENNEALKAG